MKNVLGNSKGITLIALVITIVILLILTGITINVAFSEDGLIAQSRLAKEETEMASLKEQAKHIKINMQKESTRKETVLTQNELVNEIHKQLGQSKSGNIIVNKDGKYDIIVDSKLDITVTKHGNIPDKEEKENIALMVNINENQVDASFNYIYACELPLAMTQERKEDYLFRLFNATNSENLTINNVSEFKTWAVANLEGLSGKTASEITLDEVFIAMGYNNFDEFIADMLYNKDASALAVIELTQEEIKNFVNQLGWNIAYTFLGDAVNVMSIEEIKQLIYELTNKYTDEEIYQYYRESFTTPENVDGAMYSQIAAATFGNIEVSYNGNSYRAGEAIRINSNGDYNFTVSNETYKGEQKVSITNLINWSEVYNTTSIYTDIHGEKAQIPSGFRVAITSGFNSISQGLLVKDQNDNEYIWIPVDMPVLDVSTASSETEITNKINEQIAQGNYPMSIKLSNNNYRGVLYTSTNSLINYSTSSYHEPDNIILDSSDKIQGWTSTLYQERYNEMAKSVDKYKGFYISRYKTGVYNNNLYNMFTWSDATNLVGSTYFLLLNKQPSFSQNINSNVGSDTIWGSQYDAVCRFIDNPNSVEKDKIQKNIYNLNSRQLTMESTGDNMRVSRGHGALFGENSINARKGESDLNIEGNSRLMLYVK